MSAIGTSQVLATSAESAEFTDPMEYAHLYRLVCTTDCWFSVGAAGTGAVLEGADNVYLPANMPMILSTNSTLNGFISVINGTPPGVANLMKLE